MGMLVYAHVQTFWPHDIRNRFYENKLYLTFLTFSLPKLFPSAPMRKTLPLGFSLHSSHIRRASLGGCEARSEMLTNITATFLGALQVVWQCFHIFQFLLWFNWAVPNMWITLSGKIQSVERAMDNKNPGKLCSRFLFVCLFVPPPPP